MPGPVARAVLGFVAAVLAVLLFHQAAWEGFHLAGMMPPPFPTEPTGIIGYPRIVSLMVWGGVYGAAFGLLLPRLPRPVWPWGVAMGLLAASVSLFVVAPLKGQPVAAGWDPAGIARNVTINATWGLGLGLILPALMRTRGGA